MNRLEILNHDISRILSDTYEYKYGAVLNDSDFDVVCDHVQDTLIILHSWCTRKRYCHLTKYLVGLRYCKTYDRNLLCDIDPSNRVNIDIINKSYVCPNQSLLDHPCNISGIIDHQYDYDMNLTDTVNKFNDPLLDGKRKIVLKLSKIPFYEQKSDEWLLQRTKCLTATAVCTALDEDPYESPLGLLLNKCGRGQPFIQNSNVHYGRKYEQIGTLFYQTRNNVKIMEHGLLQHPDHEFIGASPDGICMAERYDEQGLSTLVGRMLEIKFPALRNLRDSGRLNGDIVPHHYYLQMQVQMWTTGLTECDFLQCKTEEYESFEDYVLDTHPVIPTLSNKTGMEKGCLIQLLPKEHIATMPYSECILHGEYIYPPKLHMSISEIKDWISTTVINYQNNEHSKTMVIDRVIYWRLKQASCHLVLADKAWQKASLPILNQFWKYVKMYQEHPELLDKLEAYAKTMPESTALIFVKVHEHYCTLHAIAKTSMKPLYQVINPWREAINKKKAYWKR